VKEVSLDISAAVLGNKWRGNSLLAFGVAYAVLVCGALAVLVNFHAYPN